MKRLVIRILRGLVLVLAIATIAVYIQSNRVINRRHTFRPHPIVVPTDSASVAYGERLARMRCFGCHADSLYGDVFYDQWILGRLVAVNIPAKLTTLTDAEFAGFMRSGIRKDGTSPFLMPPPGFYHMSDADLGALLAYLRSLPQGGETLPPESFGPLGRLFMVLGQFKTAQTAFDTSVARVGDDPAWATTRHGEYLARVICTECHGTKLTGDPEGSPSLAGALGYSPEQFVTLIRTGTPLEAGKKLDLMAEVARNSLKYLSDAEISEIYQYIKALPSTGVPTTR